MKALKPRSPGRPRDLDKGLAILDAGWALFLERGVEATPIEAIAARAGVSKVTLYTHYADKTALFRAAVAREMERIRAAQPDPANPAAAPVQEQLHGFGLGLMTYLTSKPAIDFYGVVAGELRRHEDLARAFYELGPGQTRASLSAIIAAASRRGELVACEPGHAAEDLFGLWQGLSNFQLSLAVDIQAIRASLPSRVARGVALFMRLYGAG